MWSQKVHLSQYRYLPALAAFSILFKCASSEYAVQLEVYRLDKEPGADNVYQLCHSPAGSPEPAVFLVDGTDTSCGIDKGFGDPNWKVNDELPFFDMQPMPGGLFSTANMAKNVAKRYSLTDLGHNDYITHAPGKLGAPFRFGKGNQMSKGVEWTETYFTIQRNDEDQNIGPDNSLQVGDSLEFDGPMLKQHKLKDIWYYMDTRPSQTEAMDPPKFSVGVTTEADLLTSAYRVPILIEVSSLTKRERDPNSMKLSSRVSPGKTKLKTSSPAFRSETSLDEGPMQPIEEEKEDYGSMDSNSNKSGELDEIIAGGRRPIQPAKPKSGGEERASSNSPDINTSGSKNYKSAYSGSPDYKASSDSNTYVTANSEPGETIPVMGENSSPGEEIQSDKQDQGEEDNYEESPNKLFKRMNEDFPGGDDSDFEDDLKPKSNNQALPRGPAEPLEELPIRSTGTNPQFDRPSQINRYDESAEELPNDFEGWEQDDSPARSKSNSPSKSTKKSQPENWVEMADMEYRYRVPQGEIEVEDYNFEPKMEKPKAKGGFLSGIKSKFGSVLGSLIPKKAEKKPEENPWSGPAELLDETIEYS